jgi:phosphoglycolate phosphatase-like HAD superfamily hydrolase
MLFNGCEYIFWDFDGVIKDSIEVKSNAFFKLFEKFGHDVASKIRNHHKYNGGLSRFEKLPIYLRWAGREPTEKLISEYCIKFSKLVKQDVIESNWVPGVLDFIIENNKKSSFFLVTATPQVEIEEIMIELNIMTYFVDVIGAPTKKVDAVKKILKQYSISPNNSIMIGDSDTDFYAANVNCVSFILRRTKYNKNLQQELNCPKIYNFM